MSDPNDAGIGGDSVLNRAPCPNCGEPWLRPTQLPGRLRCVNCLSRFELVSQCPNCGEHGTIARMSQTETCSANPAGLPCFRQRDRRRGSV